MTRESAGAGMSDLAMLIVIGGIAMPCCLVWLWGGIAGAVFGRGWPAVGAGALLTCWRGCRHGSSNPAAAWPAAARSQLPGPAGFYLRARAGRRSRSRCYVVGLGARRESRSRWVDGGTGGRAGWAGAWRSCGALRGSHGRWPRLTLGRHRGRLLHAEQRHALVAFGPPQSGKSVGARDPGAAGVGWTGGRVFDQDRPAGGDAAADARRSAACSCSTRSDSPAASHTWSPLRGARTWDGALEVAWRLAAAGELDQRGVEGGDFWAIAAEQRLAPLLYTAAATEAADRHRRPLGLRPGRPRACNEALTRLGDDACDERERERRTRRLRRRARVRGAGRPHPLIDRGDRPGAAARVPVLTRRASARSCEITPDRLLDEAATLYLIGDAKASKLLRPMFLALLSEIVDRAYERATLAGGRLELPLLLCLDEAGNVAPLAEPGRDRLDGSEPQHPVGVDLPRPPAGARLATDARPRRSSTAIVRGCCCPASPTSRRCGTSPACSARKRRAITRARPAQAGPRARRPCADDRWWHPRRCARSPTVTRCCCTGGSRPPRSGCGCGSRIGGCGGSRVDELARPRGRGL